MKGYIFPIVSLLTYIIAIISGATQGESLIIMLLFMILVKVDALVSKGDGQ